MKLIYPFGVRWEIHVLHYTLHTIIIWQNMVLIERNLSDYSSSYMEQHRSTRRRKLSEIPK